MDKLNSFMNRLGSIGISISVSCNYPWVYLTSVNGEPVTHKYKSEHGFVLGLVTLNGDFNFSDISAIFKILRVYGH